MLRRQYASSETYETNFCVTSMTSATAQLLSPTDAENNPARTHTRTDLLHTFAFVFVWE